MAVDPRSRLGPVHPSATDYGAFFVFWEGLSGVEAFVAAQLWDFPDDLQIQARSSNGSIGIQVSIALP